MKDIKVDEKQMARVEAIVKSMTNGREAQTGAAQC